MARILLLLGLISWSFSGYAKDFETPHQLEPGDVLSADVLNEMFSLIENTSKSITQADIVGSWTCTSISADTDNLASAASGWALGADNLVLVLEDSSVTFADDGDGTFSMTTSTPNPFKRNDASAHNGPFTIIDDRIFIAANHHYALKRQSPNRITMHNPYPAANLTDPVSVSCDRENLPPNTPTDIEATVSGNTTTLTWTDNSSDETEFKILRRDELTGDYSLRGTSNANIVTYSDYVINVGTYWYRIKASNANGDSLGSKVVKVTID